MPNPLSKFISLFKKDEKQTTAPPAPALPNSEPLRGAILQVEALYKDNTRLLGRDRDMMLRRSSIHVEVVKEWSIDMRVELLEYLFAQRPVYAAYFSHIFSRPRVNYSTPMSDEEGHQLRLMGLLFQTWPKLLLSKQTKFTDAQLVSLLQHLRASISSVHGELNGVNDAPVALLLKSLNYSIPSRPLPSQVLDSLTDLFAKLKDAKSYHLVADREKLLLRFEGFLPAAASGHLVEPVKFAYEEQLTDYVQASISELPIELQNLWNPFVRLALTATKPKATEKLLAAFGQHVKSISEESFEQISRRWIDYALNMSPSEHHDVRILNNRNYLSMFNGYLTPTTLTLLRGVVQARAAIKTTHNVGLIEQLAWWSTVTLRGSGPRAKPLALACFNVLGQLDDAGGMAALVRLRARIKRPTILKSLDKIITESATASGIDAGTLADAATPHCDLHDGCATYHIGPYTATLEITAPGKSSFVWTTPAGKTQRTLPQEVKTSFAERLKQLKKVRKTLNLETAAQRTRIENFYRDDRSFTFSAFAKTFHAHPLLNWFSRKLIWQIREPDQEQPQVMRHYNDAWRDVSGAELKPSGAATVILWHPAYSAVDSVAAWRKHCYEHQLVQPFKQAFREVYLLTPAEETTATYSNRFAGHILEQAKLSGLCRARSWQKPMLGAWDGGDTTAAILRLPAHNLQASYFLDSVETSEDSDLLYAHVGTDQVSFSSLERQRGAGADAVPITDIPPVVFSEVMRDCDLFVAVSGVANDPSWADRGDRTEQATNYWRTTSFGALSVSAETRRDVLAKLLPRLKLRNVAHLMDRFLVIKGSRRTYKIHLGSGNVLMEPNDQYLCIVAAPAARAKTAKLYIPFEGDAKLSLILSKAFLLAADDKIDDPTILRQIER